MPHPLSPTPPEQTSLVVPVGGFRQYFKRITDWIAGLSPSGATEYDTGYVAVDSMTGFTSNAQVRRIGRNVSISGDFRPTSAGTITPSAFLNLGKIPPGFISVMNMPVYANVAAPVQGRILADGTVQAILMAGQANQSISTSTSFSIAFAAWTQP